MPLYDQHVHSHHSIDSRSEPAACVEQALSYGLAGMTFVEHFDPHPAEWDECIYDDRDYQATIDRLRSRFGDKLFVGKGIEVGYCREKMDFVLEFLGRCRFDVVMLSTHFFDNRAAHLRSSWDGLDAAEGTRLYLEEVLEMARYCESVHRGGRRFFHVLGHLDLAKRYTNQFFGTYDTSSFTDLTGEILCACLAAGVVPEINTSTLRQGLEEPMPGASTIIQYARLGGTAMSIGSDAHYAGHVGADFGKAVALLRAAGMDRMAVFKNGERTDVTLDHEK